MSLLTGEANISTEDCKERFHVRPGKVDSQLIVPARMLLHEISQNFIFHFTCKTGHLLLAYMCLLPTKLAIFRRGVIPSQRFEVIKSGKYAAIKTSTDLTAAVLSLAAEMLVKTGPLRPSRINE